MKERIEFENDLRLHYEQLQLESESIRSVLRWKNWNLTKKERLREWVTDVVGQYSEKGHAARQQMETATRSSIESMIAARLGAEESMREEWNNFTTGIQEKYETVLSELQMELSNLRKQHEERRLSEITSDESEFSKHAAMEKEIQDKYEKILRSQHDEWVTSKRFDLLKLFSVFLRCNNRDMEEQLRGTLHKANTALVEQERAHTQQKIVFEQELRTKYAQLIKEHQVTVEATQQKVLAQEVQEMQAKMHLEHERARVWEEVERKCRTEYQDKYSQVLNDVESHWKKEVLHLLIYQTCMLNY